MSSKRPVYLPPADLAEREIPSRSTDLGALVRIHRCEFGAVYFSKNPGHRFSPADGTHEVLYLGRTFSTAFLEVFGDRIYQDRLTIDAVGWSSHCHSLVGVAALKIVNLTHPKTLTTLGVDLAALHAHDLEIPQAWARALMDHSSGFDGIQFPSRFDGGDCYALFGTEATRDAIDVLETTPFDELSGAATMLDRYQVALI